MAVALYMDHNVPRAISTGLILRSIDVLTSFEDGTSTLDDSSLLTRATELGCVLFKFDDDLLTEAAKRQKSDITFAGVVYAHPLRISIGVCIQQLEIIAKAGESEDLLNSVQFLPL